MFQRARSKGDRRPAEAMDYPLACGQSGRLDL